MKKAILAKKIGMTQIFKENGVVVPVTVLEAGPCVVVQKKTADTDGYDAIQVGFAEHKARRTNKPAMGHFSKAGVTPRRHIKELRLDDISGYSVGEEIKADIFKAGENVDVSGVSKGKGFQGAIRRHNQHRGPMAHGSKYHRGLGSMGAATSPGRVPKGKKMPGHMGARKVTVQNLEIARVDADRNLLLVKGAVPGPRGTILFVKNTVKV